MNENSKSNNAWEQQLDFFFKDSSQQRALDTIDSEPMKFEWNIFPGFTTLQFVREVQEFLSNMSAELEDFTGRIIFMSMFNDISWGSKDNEKECEANANLVSIYARRFPSGQWSFLGPGSEKKWWSTHERKPQGEWDRVADHMMIRFSESGHPVFRSTSPLSRGVLKSQGGGKLSIHFCADEWTIETVFRTIISVYQLNIYGAVSDLCEEYKSCTVGTGRLVLIGQSYPLFVPKSSLMKTPTPLTDDPAQEDLLQKYQERINCHNKIVWILYWCRIPDNGWSRTVFHDRRHWRVLTIYRISGISRVNFANRWKIIGPERLDSREHHKLGPYWKSQSTIYKVNMEWQLELSL